MQNRFRSNRTQDNINLRRIEVQTEVHTVNDVMGDDDKYPADSADDVFVPPRQSSKSSGTAV